MSELEVIYDSEREIASLIDMETMRAVGPVGVGPNAEGELRQFLHAMPATVMQMNSYDLTAAYQEFWIRNFRKLYDSPDPPDEGTVGSTDDNRDPDAMLAEHEAANATDTPSEQPADTDMEADTSTATTQVIDCPNCNGDGMIQHGDEAPAEQCSMCKGKGKVEWKVAA